MNGCAEMNAPVGAIDHVEEAVLGRLHQHLAHAAVERQVGQHDRLRARVVPVVGRRRSGSARRTRPSPAGSRRSSRDTGCRRRRGCAVRATTASRCRCRCRAGRVRGRRPCRPTACRHRRTSTTRRSTSWRRVSIASFSNAEARIAGHGPEAPHLLAGLRVVGRHEAANAELRSAAAGDHPALDDARRARDAVVVGLARDLRRSRSCVRSARRARRGGCRACRRTPCRRDRRRRDSRVRSRGSGRGACAARARRS